MSGRWVLLVVVRWTMAVDHVRGYKGGEVGKDELSEGFQSEQLGHWQSWG